MLDLLLMWLSKRSKESDTNKQDDKRSSFVEKSFGGKKVKKTIFLSLLIAPAINLTIKIFYFKPATKVELWAGILSFIFACAYDQYTVRKNREGSGAGY
ncbi:hypothetical protein GMSM_46620 [Geomonas sp. Red276]